MGSLQTWVQITESDLLFFSLCRCLKATNATLASAICVVND